MRTFYELEGRRQRLRTWGYLVTWYAGWIAIMFACYLAYQMTNSAAALVAMVVALVGWWYGWPRLWRAAILPRLASPPRK